MCILIGFYFFFCEEDSKGSFKSERQVTLYTLIKFLASYTHHHSSFMFHSVTENISVAKLSWCGEHHTPNICYYFLIPWLTLYTKNMKEQTWYCGQKLTSINVSIILSTKTIRTAASIPMSQSLFESSEFLKLCALQIKKKYSVLF